jgi:hypothetical protein
MQAGALLHSARASARRPGPDERELRTLWRPRQPPEEAVQALVVEQVRSRRLAAFGAAGAAVRGRCGRALDGVDAGVGALRRGGAGRGCAAAGGPRRAALLQHALAHEVARGGDARAGAGAGALAGGGRLQAVHPAGARGISLKSFRSIR